MSSQIMKRIFCVCALLLATGCSSYGVIKNKPLSNVPAAQKYSIKAFGKDDGTGRSADIGMMLSFSGGGTRRGTGLRSNARTARDHGSGQREHAQVT